MIPRESYERRVRALLDRHPVVALLGARQVGKTTLARAIVRSEDQLSIWFDLQNPDDLARLEEPTLALDPGARQLRPWHENVGKRQVKSPKVYVADPGLLHTLLDLRTLEDREGHPKVGASWEGFVLGELMVHLQLDPQEMYFWGTHAGAELELFVRRGNRRLGFALAEGVRAVALADLAREVPPQ